MRIGHNLMAMNSYRQLSFNSYQVENSMEKLSSGLRINRAGDDAAGLAISEKMRAQIRGLEQEKRNIQDGISLIQTAEGGMGEVHSLLQRGRELSVQGKNDTLSEEDRKHIQSEIDEIVKEVDRIANTTEFNTINLLNVTSSTANQDQKLAVEALQKYWLKNSEDLITTHYGLTADGAPLDIQFIQNSGDGRVAWVQGSYYTTGTDGRYFNQKLVLDMSDFSPISMPNGGGSWISNDRIIAHEMTHAVMGRTTNMRDLPTWFVEGAAEFIAGADERLAVDSNNGADFATLKNEIDAWNSTSADYSAAYAAVKFLDAKLGAPGIRALFDDIKLVSLGGAGKSLNQALNDRLGYSGGVADFIADFKANATLANSGINLADSDTGAIGGGDDNSTVPDTVNSGTLTDPLTGFVENWPSFNSATSSPLRVGPSVHISLSDVSSKTLGIDMVNILSATDDNISMFDGAIEYVSGERARLGAYQNRLEKAMEVTLGSHENLTAAESRIRDVDMASQMMTQTKYSILSQAAQAMLSQGNQSPQGVLQLLR
ncbi:flagellinolysin [Paenibacillus silviterrae]|uniref:flagellinolysin n=1 Tax=Paenibacillus silviterrae TaxID=3242194 RepID=UPI002543BD78|nr:flagellinolysin [Paenibacillus chinjuensis]